MNKLQSKNPQHIFWALVVVMFVFMACNNQPSGVLNQNDMVDVLTDLHKLDGSMSAKNFREDQTDLKNQYYNSILKKHGITQAEFDSSVVWYTKNPKKFDRVYTKVIENLTNLENDVKKGKYHPIDSTELDRIKINIWNKRQRYALTKDSARTRLSFEIPDQGFMLGDMYILRFRQRIAIQDSCEEPVIRLQINYVNGRIRGIEKRVHRDGKEHIYLFRLAAVHKMKIKSISGELLGSAAYKGTLNSTTDSITLTRIYSERKQDSLLKVLQKADPKHYPMPVVPTVAPVVNDTNKLIRRNIRSLILRK